MSKVNKYEKAIRQAEGTRCKRAPAGVLGRYYKSNTVQDEE